MNASISVSVYGTAEITNLIKNARTQWASESERRLALGEIFSKLRASIDKYSRNNEKGEKITYVEAVRKTGVPRGTAELYRHMFEVCDTNNIPADAFILLCQAGFNLATDLSTETTVAAVLKENDVLTSVEKMLALSEKETTTLVETLRKDFGKEQAESDSIADLQESIARQKQTQSQSKDADYKEFLQKQIDAETVAIRNKMLWALRSIANALASFIGKPEGWGDEYVKQFKQDGKVTVLVEQAYAEAMKFAQSATFLSGGKKPAVSVTSERKTAKRA